MARGVNKVILIGNLGADPEVTYTTNATPIVNVSLATSEKYKPKGKKDYVEATEWHKLVFWRKLAETVAKYLTKGSQIYVEGKLKTRVWDHKDGTKRYTTEIHVHEMQMLDRHKEKDEE